MTWILQSTPCVVVPQWCRLIGKQGIAALALVCAAESLAHAQWPREAPEAFSDLSYPAESRAAGRAGVVFVEVASDETGRIVQARALDSRGELANAAVANARGWRISPSVTGGVIVYRFDIAEGRCNDDATSISRLVNPNEMVITTCRGPNRPYATHERSHPFSWPRDAPTYPPLARSARMFGVVVLEVTIGEEGRLSATALTQLPFFTEAALAHVAQWQPLRSGVGGRYLLAYEFALDNHACSPATQSGFWVVAPGVVRLSGCDFQ